MPRFRLAPVGAEDRGEHGTLVRLDLRGIERDAVEDRHRRLLLPVFEVRQGQRDAVGEHERFLGDKFASAAHVGAAAGERGEITVVVLHHGIGGKLFEHAVVKCIELLGVLPFLHDGNKGGEGLSCGGGVLRQLFQLLL